jgi:large subunit ribosomal protein L25
MELVLTADPTRETGTRPSRRLRRDGRVPAVVYGMGTDPVAISVVWRDLRQCLKTDAGINVVIDLDIDGARHTSIVKDIQRHPVRRDVIHVDFLRVDVTIAVTVDVPVLVTGEAKKVAALQGIVDQQLFKIEVSVRPDAIPNEIEVDVTDLDIGDVITVGDITLPPGVTAVSELDATVVQGSATRSTITMRAEAAQGVDADGAPIVADEDGDTDSADADGGTDAAADE